MAARWLKSTVDVAGRRSLRFIPLFVPLEDRAVPATFFVDPTLAGSTDGDAVVFNSGNVGEVTGLSYASSQAFWNANKATANTFSDLSIALAVAEANPGADTVRLASGQIPLDNSALTTLDDNTKINSSIITQPLTIIGSGIGASVVIPTTNTQSDYDDGNGTVDDEFTSLVRVTGADASLTAQNFRLDGGGKLVGVGFFIREGATANFSKVGVSGTIFEPNGVSSGVGILSISSTTNINATEVSSYGRVGVLFFDTKGVISNSTITGRGAGVFANNGIEIDDGSEAFITGNLITGNNGTVNPGDLSSGVIVAQGDAGGGNGSGAPSTAFLIGNTISGNTVGINVGAVVADDSELFASFNNIVNNQFGAEGGLANNPIQAKNNWWGAVSGPFNATSNKAGLGNSAGPAATVVFDPTGSGSNSTVTAARQHMNPRIATLDTSSFQAGIDSYLTQITTVNANVNPVGPALLTSPTSKVSFAITFSTAVAGLTTDNITVTSTTGGTPVLSLTGSGQNYTLEVSGLSGEGAVSASIDTRAADDTALGFLTAASNVATITIDVPNGAPTLAPIDDVSTTNGASVGPIAVVVGDDAGLNGVTLSATSSNGALVDPTSLVFTGTGANRTLNFETTPNVFGNSIITVAATDADGLVTTTTFLVSVPNGAPTIGNVPDQTGTPGSTGGPITIALTDDGDVSGVSLAGTSSNPALIDPASIAFTGTGANRSLTYQTSPGVFGSSIITLTATDAAGGVTTETFLVTVPQPANTAPTITNLPDQTTTAGTAIPSLSFMIGDAETAVGDLVVTSTSSNATLFPASAISITGSGANRTLNLTPAAGLTGTSVITLTVTDAAGLSSQTSFAVTVNENVAEVKLFAVGGDAGFLPEVAVYGINGKVRNTFLAYESTFTGGVTVATADVDGDGTEDIVTGAGFLGGARIRVFSGVDGAELANFFAFDTAFRGGVNVAAADLDGDGKAEVIAGAGFGGGPHVKAYKIANGTETLILNFMAFDSSLRTGVTVAAGLVGTGMEIAVGLGQGSTPSVARFAITNSGSSFTATPGETFLAGPSSFSGGVFVTIGSFGGTVGNSIVTSLGNPSAPVVTFQSDDSTLTVYEAAVTTGVRIGASDVNGDGVDELLVAPGAGGGSRIQAFTADGDQVLNFFAFNNAERDGYFIG